MEHFDLLIRNGRVFDGTGSDGFQADIGIKDGIIAALGDIQGTATDEIDAENLIVTPGFVDLHTHYDGQVTWSNELSPSSNHGVTTVVLGNCGVGFAPCKAPDHETLIDLMSGVEDIPEIVMAEGIPWDWHSYPEFVDRLAAKQFDVDVASLLPHSALRVFVMGERALAREAATEADVTEMAHLAHQAMDAGALGFATSRMLQHRSAHGESIPTARAAEHELSAIAMAMTQAGKGVFQIASDFELYTDIAGEFEMFRRIAHASGRPIYYSLNQKHHSPDDWKQLLSLTDAANRDGLEIRAQVMGRPTGLLLGHELSKGPFHDLPSYRPLLNLSFDERITKLREPELRVKLLAEMAALPEKQQINFKEVFVLSNPPNYEQPAENSIFARAEAAGTSPSALAYDLLLENGGRSVFLHAMQNYADGSLEVPLAMMRNPNTVFGLGDGGAHLGLICDASWPTTMLAYWTRDRSRGDLLPLPWVVKAMTWDNARAYGLNDRGRVAVGQKADLNIIDYQKLDLQVPEVRYDLPAGGRRIVQRANGYAATIVGGVITRRHGESTKALPGRFVRGPQSADLQSYNHLN